MATAAGHALLELRATASRFTDLGAAGDRLSHQFLVKELGRLYPDDDVRSEEGLEHVSGSGRLWIIDPLDGTREFRQRERSDWAVHVALVIGGVAVVGAVALPALDITLSTAAPRTLAERAENEPPRVIVSRTRPPEVAYDVARAIGGVMIPMGSAGAKIGAVVLGGADVYVHAGGQYEWDSAAPVAVAVASGLHASRLNGDPLRYGAPDAWLPDLVVCRPELTEDVLAVTTADRRLY
ncbi:MAG: inositol monophosphatase family protein [Acidimicrobiales bacterium]